MKSTVYAHLENDYRFYRLPLFRATAVKYGWDNPIGEDSGRERKYERTKQSIRLCFGISPLLDVVLVQH